MRASSKCPRVETLGVASPPPSSTGDAMAEEPVDSAAADDVPPPSTSNDLNIQHMLETIITIQAAHGQILVDMLDKLRALQADLEHLRRSPPPSPFDDGL